MQKQSKNLDLLLFLIQLINRSKKQGLCADYIKGQFDVAYRQLGFNKNYGESDAL